MIRLVLLLSLFPAIAFAQADYTARYQIRFGPLRVAEAILQASESGGSYAVAGRVTSAGLAGAFRDIRFDLASEGRIEASGLRPLAYREDVDTGRRLSELALGYENGIPTIRHALPPADPGPWTLDPLHQSGTIDPMSALYMIARPRAYDALCDWSVFVFDGVRRSSITLGPVVVRDGAARCAGAYRRLAGFSPEDLDEQHVFAFNAEFSSMEDGVWRLTRVETQTLYGRVRLLLVD